VREVLPDLVVNARFHLFHTSRQTFPKTIIFVTCGIDRFRGRPDRRKLHPEDLRRLFCHRNCL